MSSFSIIHDVSLELRAQVFDALTSTPDVDFGLTDEASNIALDPPSDDGDSNVRASLYLYHVDTDKHLRNQRMLPSSQADDELRLPPMPLQLRYLFTPRDSDERNNHLILGRVLQHFYDHPSFGSLAGNALGDSFGGASEALRIRPDMLSIEQLSQVWNAFSRPYRLSQVFLIEVVAIDSAKAPLKAPRVIDAYGVVGIKERA